MMGLWILLLLHSVSAEIATRSTIHYVDVLRLRCDSLPYRTVFHKSNCYFAIDADVNSTATANRCSRALPGAKLVGEAPDAVWTALYFNENEFVRDGYSIGKKRAMCLAESRFPCLDKSTANSGTCRRVEKVDAVREEQSTLNYVLPLPYIYKFKEKIVPGQSFIVKGRTFSTATHWSCNFHAPSANPNFFNPSESVPLYISVDHYSGMIIFGGRPYGAGYSAWDRKAIPESMKNKPFEFRILAHKDHFQIWINGVDFYTQKHRMPLETISHFSILDKIGYGDLHLYYVHLGGSHEPVPTESGITTTGFSYCKTMFISGMIMPQAPGGVLHNEGTRASINLVRKNGTPSTDNAMQWLLRYDTGNLAINDVKNGIWGKEEVLPLPFARGVPFNLTVTNEPRGFVILVNGKPSTTFAHRVRPFDITSIWIQYMGDLNVEVSNAANCSNEISICERRVERVDPRDALPPKLNYVLSLPYIYKLKGKIVPGHTIIVRGRTFSTATHWSCNFHAPSANPNFFNPTESVPLYISVDHPSGMINFGGRPYGGGYVVWGRKAIPESMKNKPFEFRILAHKDHFQMWINNEEFYTHQHRMPLESISHFTILDKIGYGDLHLHYVYLGGSHEPVPTESGITTTGFSYCKTMFVTGIIMPQAPGGVLHNEGTRASINLVRKNGSWDRDNAMQWLLRYDIGNLAITDCKNGQWGTPEVLPLPFARGVPFNVTITNDPRGFVILVNGQPSSTFAHRFCPLDITSVWIQYVGDLNVEVANAAQCTTGKAAICG